MHIIGLDSGSSATKGVLFHKGQIIKHMMVPTGYNPSKTLLELYLQLKGELRDEDIYTVTTGYGRDLLPMAHKRITEITCHAKGVSYLRPEACAVIDIGGQDSKVILMDDQQMVTDFLMNDKCAAGTGRFVEVIMRILHKDFYDLEVLLTEAADLDRVKISSMCTVFAESEVISLLAQQIAPQAIARGVLDAICERTAVFARRLPIKPTVFFSGGLAQSEAIRSQLQEALGMAVVSHAYSQFAGAIGAAVIGAASIGYKGT